MREHSTTNIEHRTSKDDQPTPELITQDGWSLHDGEPSRRTFDLEERLLEFASAVIDLSEKLPASRAGNHVAGQILRSGTSPYPNHGEAEAAESRGDFVHKLKVCLKELRETRRWARLVERKRWAPADSTLTLVLRECDELIRIFYSSIQTAQKNALVQKHGRPDATRYPAGEAG
jgi:four helix bundle protein